MYPKNALSYLATTLLTTVPILAGETTSSRSTINSRSSNGNAQKYTAQQVIAELGLEPNVEKGYFTESFRDAALYGNRSVSTAIYYLLEGSAGRSYWHRVDATEVWHYYAGAPLSLYLSNDDGQPVRESVLGPKILDGQRPQVVIDPFEWQQAQSQGPWTLVGTTEGFELAPPDWQPDGAASNTI